MKKLLFLFLLVVSFNLSGQEKIKFTYDASGNRIKKEIVLSSTKLASEEVNEIFTEKMSERNIKIYPNPTKGQLMLDISDIEDIKSGNLTVYNMQGQMLINKKISDVQTILDISSRPNGIYILHINIDGEKKSWRIIKE